MMKRLSTLLVLTLLVASAGIFAVTSTASAQSAPDGIEAADGRGNGGQQGNRWLSRDEKRAIMADALGMTVEALEAAKDAGQSLDEIIAAQGLTTEEYEAALQAGLIAAANQAVTDGELTQEQADTIIANIESGNFGFGNHNNGNSGSRWLSRSEKRAIVAEALGMTVEDYEAAKDAEQSLDEIMTAQGLTTEQYEAALQAGLIAAANQAVTDGELTQEQADAIIAEIESGNFTFGSHSNHNGGSRWLSRSDKRAIVAGVLGMTVEELEAAKDAGQSMEEILTAQGLTTGQYEADLQAALIDAANQAVTDGDLAQDEADVIIVNIESGLFGSGCNGHGWHSGSDNGDAENNDDAAPADDETPAEEGSDDPGAASRLDTQLPVRIFIPLVSQNA